jgi:hypothetical protein
LHSGAENIAALRVQPRDQFAVFVENGFHGFSLEA